MPSPFPGMDPYLEDPRYWRQFHHLFITYLFEAINHSVPDPYAARIDERTKIVDVATGESAEVIPDVQVDRPRGNGAAGQSGVAVTTDVGVVELPLTILDEETEGYIEIIKLPERELVAVVEVLSPSNKIGDGRKEFIIKRNAFLRREVHFVELDLLVGGKHMPTQVPRPPGDYFVTVARHERHPVGEMYHFTVRQKLPTVRIPLKAPDPDVQIDLGAVFATTYDRGYYRRDLDYSRPLAAPLSEADRAWAAEVARAPRA